ncbi:MAG TPA: arylamine N-acetyltransferase [Blastocatellia bacterium]|nr:arylamine N-acetyltransferase [Blastocatellia bacterium]
MDIKSYLRRINFEGPLSLDARTLRDLQVAHLLSVPFENLSIHAGEPIVIREELLFEKIVSKRRGGFCYELNGLFAALLRESGFKVSMLSAGVARPDGTFGPDFDHMTLLVELEDRWLADVGFGDSFREPLLVDARHAQVIGDRSYRIDAQGESLTLLESVRGGEWMPQYRFTLRPHQYSDYEGMCVYHQTSPDSHFTQRRVCSMATTGGRVTLSDRRLITTRGGERQERELADEGEYVSALRDYFGITMGKV